MGVWGRNGGGERKRNVAICVAGEINRSLCVGLIVVRLGLGLDFNTGS